MKKTILVLVLVSNFFTLNILFGQKRTVNTDYSDYCKYHPSKLASNISEVFFKTDMTQLVIINNPTNTSIQIGKLFIDGQDAAQFVLQDKLSPFSSQPQQERCSNTTLAPNRSCSFRVVSKSPNNNYALAKLNIPTSGACDLKISITQCKSATCY